MLEDAGCRVIYGLPDQKVHSKLCVITRQSVGGLSRITQVGTGNYNEVESMSATAIAPLIMPTTKATTIAIL